MHGEIFKWWLTVEHSIKLFEIKFLVGQRVLKLCQILSTCVISSLNVFEDPAQRVHTKLINNLK